MDTDAIPKAEIAAQVFNRDGQLVFIRRQSLQRPGAATGANDSCEITWLHLLFDKFFQTGPNRRVTCEGKTEVIDHKDDRAADLIRT